MIGAIERALQPNWTVAADRLRAALWRLRGAALGPKSRVGPRCVIRKPWCLRTGARVEIEHSAFFKVTDDRARIVLGDEVFVGCGSELDIAHELIVGNHVLIAPGCFITDHAHRHDAGRRIAEQGCESGPVRIDDDVWLGAHAVVLPGVTIGRGAIVGANAVVSHDVAPMTIVAGVPARPIGVR